MSEGFTPADWMELLVDNAKKLREAGVTKVSFPGCQLELSPPVIFERGADEPRKGPEDPWNSPDLYAGGVVPGLPVRDE